MQLEEHTLLRHPRGHRSRLSKETGTMSPTTPMPRDVPVRVKDALPSTIFRFMDLPRELRINIYEELVVVGKIFYTPHWYTVSQSVRFEDHNKFRKPMLTILRVSHSVSKEAEEVYLTKSLFVLPPQWHYPRHVDTLTGPKSEKGSSPKLLAPS